MCDWDLLRLPDPEEDVYDEIYKLWTKLRVFRQLCDDWNIPALKSYKNRELKDLPFSLLENPIIYNLIRMYLEANNIRHYNQIHPLLEVYYDRLLSKEKYARAKNLLEAGADPQGILVSIYFNDKAMMKLFFRYGYDFSFYKVPPEPYHDGSTDHKEWKIHECVVEYQKEVKVEVFLLLRRLIDDDVKTYIVATSSYN